MSGCPDEECYKKLDILCKYVWGRDGEADGGLVGKINEVRDCAKKKIPKSWLAIFFLTFGMIMITSGYKCFHGIQAAETATERNEKLIEKNAQAISDLKEIVYQNRIDQIKSQTKTEVILKNLEEIKEIVEENEK